MPNRFAATFWILCALGCAKNPLGGTDATDDGVANMGDSGNGNPETDGSDPTDGQQGLDGTDPTGLGGDADPNADADTSAGDDGGSADDNSTTLQLFRVDLP